MVLQTHTLSFYHNTWDTEEAYLNYGGASIHTVSSYPFTTGQFYSSFSGLFISLLTRMSGYIRGSPVQILSLGI